MSGAYDCQRFMERLDDWAAAGAPERELSSLRAHARSCPDCATLLEIEEHVAELKARQLEAEVPGELVRSMWPRVRAGLGRRSDPQRWRWAGPLLAAASLLLFVIAGLLAREVRSLREREGELAGRISDQGHRLAELELRDEPGAGARTAGLAATESWQRMLVRTESVSLAELKQILAGVPAGSTLLGPAETDRLLTKLAPRPADLRRLAQAEIRSEDGLQAGEALRVLEELRVSPARRIATRRLLDLSVGPRARTRS